MMAEARDGVLCNILGDGWTDSSCALQLRLNPISDGGLLRLCTHARRRTALKWNISIPVRSLVSNEDMGKLRIQFFRDGLNAVLAGGGMDLRFPIFEVLHEVNQSEPRLDLSVLHTLVDARERDLSYPSFKTVSSLCAFARDVQSPLIHAHAHCLVRGQTPPLELPVACSFAGEAVGLSVLLRGTPAQAAQRLTYVPVEISAGLGVRAADLLSGGGAAVQAFQMIAGAANRALLLAEDALRGLPAEVRPAFWVLELPRIYLSRLTRAGFNPFDESLQAGMLQTYPLALQLSVLKARVLRR